MSAIPRQGGGYQWDERRNTSRVFQPPPGSLDVARRALRSLDPALRRWLEDGHPSLTESEHVQRFGEPFKSSRQRKANPTAAV